MPYEFHTLDGRFLAAIDTDTPHDHIGELAQAHGVDADEIRYGKQCDLCGDISTDTYTLFDVTVCTDSVECLARYFENNPKAKHLYELLEDK